MLNSRGLSLEGKNYAIIVDEAHSSQSGKAAGALRKTLGDAEMSDGDELEDWVTNQIKARGPQSNLSFYAFTATPKPKTLEMFGNLDANGEPAPFTLYSMRQAIEEGFILDVLKNYVSYKELYEIVKKTPDDPEHNKSKSKKQIARFASLHEAAVDQKVAIIVEHFREQVLAKGKIKGKAKAMVVTRSRLHAVRYHLAFQKYLDEHGYTDMKTLVAFSGTVDDQDESYTESGLNGFEDSKTPDRFDTGEYQVLVVAEKYQTGFDQPLLHTMYVDKVLTGIAAVQTLSRLNRCHPDKKDTCVVDFVNDRDTIYKSFKPYFETTSIAEVTNPNHVYAQQTSILEYGLIRDQDIEGFAELFFKPKLNKGDTGRMDSLIQATSKRWDDSYNPARGDDALEEGQAFKDNIRSFLKLYEFVTQLTPFVDVDLEKFYVFVKHLLPALPFYGEGENEDLSNEIELAQYRADIAESGHILLDDEQEAEPLPNPTAGGRGSKPGELLAPLSQIIQEFNEKFGLNFKESDIRWMEDVEAETEADDVLVEQARNSDPNAFKSVYDDKALDLLIDRRERDEDLFNVLVGNDQARGFLFDRMRDAFLKRVIADAAKSMGTHSDQP